MAEVGHVGHGRDERRDVRRGVKDGWVLLGEQVSQLWRTVLWTLRHRGARGVRRVQKVDFSTRRRAYERREEACRCVRHGEYEVLDVAPDPGQGLESGWAGERAGGEGQAGPVEERPGREVAACPGGAAQGAEGGRV